MRTHAAVLYEMGRPAPYAGSHPLVVDEVELEGPGPGEALVELVSAGLCHSDLSVIDGSRPRPLPMVLGHEAAGVVREVGRGVAGLRPGDHVIFSFMPMCGTCEYCAAGRPVLCERGARANLEGCLLSGARRWRDAAGRTLNHHLGVSGFARHTVAAQESLIPIDPDFPLEQAALFGCAVITGVGAVVNTARVQPGMSAAVWGLGGVGLSAVMGARLAGAHPIVAVDRLAHKLELARALGATHTVDAAAEDPVAAVRELTGGGAHYAFEVVGSEQVLIQAYQATRRGGTTVTVGLPASGRMFSAPAVAITAEERTIKGSFMGSAVPRRDIPRFIALYRAGLLPVDALRSRTIALEEINQGFDALATGEAVRQIIAF
ncbi:MAG TPA: zinc-dependent alcohol dehydrogenase family protein [Roseiflexaceae bacterium]|nr:zinc-dependent alcohol dehydrogenase family protein [Roseiflexaceae bacterium]